MLFGRGGFADSAKEILGKEFIVSCFETQNSFRKCSLWILKYNSRRSYANCHLQGKAGNKFATLNKHLFMQFNLSKHQEALLD